MSGKSNSVSAARRMSARRRSEASAPGLAVLERLCSASSTRDLTVSVGVRAAATDAVRPRSSAAVMVIRVRRMLPPGFRFRELPPLSGSTGGGRLFPPYRAFICDACRGTIVPVNRTMAATPRAGRPLVVVDLGGTWVRVSVSGAAPRDYRGPTPGVAGPTQVLARHFTRQSPAHPDTA